MLNVQPSLSSRILEVDLSQFCCTDMGMEERSSHTRRWCVPCSPDTGLQPCNSHTWTSVHRADSWQRATRMLLSRTDCYRQGSLMISSATCQCNWDSSTSNRCCTVEGHQLPLGKSSRWSSFLALLRYRHQVCTDLVIVWAYPTVWALASMTSVDSVFLTSFSLARFSDWFVCHLIARTFDSRPAATTASLESCFTSVEVVYPNQRSPALESRQSRIDSIIDHMIQCFISVGHRFDFTILIVRPYMS